MCARVDTKEPGVDQTANLKGGANCNLELDLVNEFLNRDFIGMEILLLLCFVLIFMSL